MAGEIWKDIPQHEHYQVSNLGNIRSKTHYDKLGRLYNGRLRRTKKNNHGYVMLVLNHDKSVLVHRIVAMTFLGMPKENQEVNHKDGDKTNNTVENLEWVTKSENQRHRYDSLKKISESQVSQMKVYTKAKKDNTRAKVPMSLVESKMLLKDVAALTGVSISTISRMRNERG